MTYIIIICLLALSAMFSGLTLGLLSLNLTDLERKIKLGDADAKKVYPIRKKGNLLLCTLLMGNVAVNSALSIFLGGLASGVLAGIIATGLIVVFGEIVPQAACSRHALRVGAKTVGLVKIFIFIFYPISWPLAKSLDKLLGAELPTVWSKHELKEIIKYHEDSPQSSLDSDEERIILGALSFSEKTAADVMTPRIIVFALDEETVINEKIISVIKKQGFTRIPVYSGQLDNIIGIMYVDDLIGIKTEVKVKDLYRKNNIVAVLKDEKLDTLFNKLIQARVHIAFVYDKHGMFCGVATLEDIIEEIMHVEIVDEADKVVDLRAEAKEKAMKIFQTAERD